MTPQTRIVTEVVQATASPSATLVSTHTSTVSAFKRAVTPTDNFGEAQKYPDWLFNVPDDQLTPLQCESTAANLNGPYEAEFYITGNPDISDTEKRQIIQDARAASDSYIITAADFCKNVDQIITLYQDDSSKTKIYKSYVELTAPANFTAATAPAKSFDFFSCNKILQYTEAHDLYYECHGSAGVNQTRSDFIYKLNLDSKKNSLLYQCDTVKDKTVCKDLNQ